jgi:hypothetical protein
MKTIPLTKGKAAIVDDADYEWLVKFKWFASSAPSGRFYAMRNVPSDVRRQKKLRMHRAITGCDNGLDVDHINGDSLDNRRGNLRICTRSQNQCNRGKTRVGTSGFKGVSWFKGKSRWRAAIRLDGRSKHLGYYDSKVSAAIAYNIAAVQMHGEFARLNDVFSGEVAL